MINLNRILIKIKNNLKVEAEVDLLARINKNLNQIKDIISTRHHGVFQPFRLVILDIV